MKEKREWSVTELLDIRRGAVIAKVHLHIPYSMTNGVRVDHAFLDQIERCKDNMARRIILGIR